MRWWFYHDTYLMVATDLGHLEVAQARPRPGGGHRGRGRPGGPGPAAVRAAAAGRADLAAFLIDRGAHVTPELGVLLCPGDGRRPRPPRGRRPAAPPGRPAGPAWRPTVACDDAPLIRSLLGRPGGDRRGPRLPRPEPLLAGRPPGDVRRRPRPGRGRPAAGGARGRDLDREDDRPLLARPPGTATWTWSGGCWRPGADVAAVGGGPGSPRGVGRPGGHDRGGPLSARGGGRGTSGGRAPPYAWIIEARGQLTRG